MSRYAQSGFQWVGKGAGEGVEREPVGEGKDEHEQRRRERDAGQRSAAEAGRRNDAAEAGGEKQRGESEEEPIVEGRDEGAEEEGGEGEEGRGGGYGGEGGRAEQQEGGQAAEKRVQGRAQRPLRLPLPGARAVAEGMQMRDLGALPELVGVEVGTQKRGVYETDEIDEKK